jgi:2-hydroxychromene-2-carboxylate isomerase
MRTLTWYFDFISPFAYLQSPRLDDFAMEAVVQCRPVLFAGILNHYGHKGPAEIPPKRVWTFEHVAWLAKRHGVALTMPPMHPFNPLPLLRLAVLLDAPVDVVQRLFRFVWQEGKLPSDTEAWHALLAELQVDPSEIDQPDVKDALRENTEEAIAAGVFGVPTTILDGQLFWGFDSTEMIQARLEGDPFFESELLKAARALPEGIRRPGT